MDKQTEEGLKRMMQDYEYQTTGIPQRLDHALYEGYARGIAQANRNQERFDAQTEEIVQLTKKNIRNATYEQLKQNYEDYTKCYEQAVRSNKTRWAIAKFLLWGFGLVSLGSAGIGIATCFFDYNTMPELLKPFSDGGGILMMGAFFVFGVLWWIMYAIVSSSVENPEYSGMAGRYLKILEVVENKLKSKKFINRFKSDPYFSSLNEDDLDDEDEEELYEDELGNYYADDDPENPKNQKTDRGTINEKHGFYSNDTSLYKTMKIKEHCEDKKNEKTSRIILAIIPIIILVGVIFSISLNSTLKKANNLKENIETNSPIENNKEKEYYNFIDTNDFKDNNVIDNITSQTEKPSNSTNIENESTSSTNENSNNMTSTNNNTSINSKPKKEMIEMPYFQMGYELRQYTDQLDNLGIKYKIVKKSNLNYENNTVTNVEHNGENIEKGTTITITVADNVYNLNVRFDTYYLLELADISAADYENKTINVKVDVNGKNVFNGNLPLTYADWADTAFTIKGKPDIRNDFEITVEGKKITKPIKTYYFYTYEHEIWVCKDFRIGS